MPERPDEKTPCPELDRRALPTRECPDYTLKPELAASAQTGGLEAPAGAAVPAGLECLVGSTKPDRVKENGCEIFRDENAKAKLGEWGYPWMGGSRYPFDENLKGWEQFDTPQDASYYGVWISVDRMATVNYAEGDVCLVVAPDMEAFRAEVRELWDWNRNYKPGSGVHTQLDSPKLAAACLVGHPAFDAVMAEYRKEKALEVRYQELHPAVFKALDDPSLPPNQFRVLCTEDYAFFQRQHPGDYQVVCASQIVGGDYDLNRPQYTLTPGGWGATQEHITLLERFLQRHGQPQD